MDLPDNYQKLFVSYLKILYIKNEIQTYYTKEINNGRQRI
jgi:hypothetical protein